MANIKKSKKSQPQQGSELLEDPQAIAEKLSRTEEFIEKNRKWVFIVGGIIVVITAAFFFYRYYIDNRDELAQGEMFQAVYYFENDSLNLALNGDGNNYGFLEIIDDYPMTEAANLAQFYTGVSYLKLERFEEAIDYLKEFTSSDYVVKARALSLIGDAYMELESYQEAAEFYEDAADYKPNQYFTPQYLMKGALAYEMSGNLEEAQELYQTIVDEYIDSNLFQEAKKQLARLEALASR
ncbi:MAG: tetratricopeptide repeat protein [Candidatus Cyclobacteriaceae bacterium M3_2C_046]